MKRTAAILISLAGLTGTAAAQSTPAPLGTLTAEAGAHTHDGLFLRGVVGFNGTHLSTSEPDMQVYGPGGTVGLAAGWAVARNLIVYGEIFDDIAVSPTVKLGDATLETTEDTSAGVIAFGGGVAYYIMPINIYASLTLAAAQLTVSRGDKEVGNSDFGFGASLMVGKEWWVASDVGLGVALQLYGGTMKDKGADEATWRTGAVALVLSATYN
jgi:hypothetical protein